MKKFPDPKADSILRPSGLESETLRIEQSWLHECEGIAACESHLRRKKNDVTSAEKKRREQTRIPEDAGLQQNCSAPACELEHTCRFGQMVDHIARTKHAVTAGPFPRAKSSSFTSALFGGEPLAASKKSKTLGQSLESLVRTSRRRRPKGFC